MEVENENLKNRLVSISGAGKFLKSQLPDYFPRKQSKKKQYILKRYKNKSFSGDASFMVNLKFSS